jgi:hypothetical protein
LEGESASTPLAELLDPVCRSDFLGAQAKDSKELFQLTTEIPRRGSPLSAPEGEAKQWQQHL